MTTRWTHGQAITWDGRPGYIQHLGPQHLTIEVQRPGRRPQVLTVRADSPRWVRCELDEARRQYATGRKRTKKAAR